MYRPVRTCICLHKIIFETPSFDEVEKHIKSRITAVNRQSIAFWLQSNILPEGMSLDIDQAIRTLTWFSTQVGRYMKRTNDNVNPAFLYIFVNVSNHF